MAYEIQLSFLPLHKPLPPLAVFRRERRASDKKSPADHIYAFWLRSTPTSATKDKDYWVAFAPHQGFEPYQADSLENISLTKRWILEAIDLKCRSIFCDASYRQPEKHLVREVAIKLTSHNAGEEQIVLQPYFLESTRNFGLLVDFRFALAKEASFSREVLRLSLALDDQNRRNANFYADKRAKIDRFLQQRFQELSIITLNGTSAQLARNFETLPAQSLDHKIYLVDGNHECSGPFSGILRQGALEPIAACPPLVFLFREQERQAGRDLVRALRGQVSQLNFVGFQKLFRVELPVSSNPVVLKDFSLVEMQRALAEVQRVGPKALPILILPGSETEGYITHKAVFTSAGIPTQVCTTETLADDLTLKWSVGNIALQIFCKAGGKPWKIKPTDDHCLIIGISQSHREAVIDGKRTIEKYFAFSILTDSSGLFQSIEVIGQGATRDEYIAELTQNLTTMLAAKAADFSKVVLHTSFKLRNEEMEVIEKVVAQASSDAPNCRFAVIKVNQRNRFFGYNKAVNSLVPYEGTYVQLSKREFLLWFEGLFPDKPNVTKAVPGPTHIEFLRVSHQDLIGDRILLQDLLNLSGANWRGFNAKSTPVSIFYCHLVADLLQEFHQKRLPMPQIHDMHPWFL
jgi:hypothetical protein